VVIASVHPWVRWPDRVPPDRGGHLVLVTGRDGGQLILNNPSGLPGTSQHAARIALTDFARFYAGRGIVIAPARAGLAPGGAPPGWGRRDREVSPGPDGPRMAARGGGP
jgi:hypothetical protein